MALTFARPALVAFAGCLLAAGCATTEDTASNDPLAEFAEDPRLGEEAGRICFTGQIDSFSMASDRSVVVEAGVRDYYLVTLVTRCQDLDFAQSLAFDSMGSCLSRGDAIYAFDSAFGPDRTDFPAQRCIISNIYKWNPDAAEETEAEAEET